MTRRLFAAAALASAFSVACFSTSRTAPSGSSSSLAGTWASQQSGSVQDSCTNFTWSVTQFTGSTGSGTFTATCFGNIQVAGTAQATLTTANSGTWSVAANASGPNVPTPCPITLSGTATINGDLITIPYSGSWCLGPLSGTETVRRR
jgi:hypothetical protein